MKSAKSAKFVLKQSGKRGIDERRKKNFNRGHMNTLLEVALNNSQSGRPCIAVKNNKRPYRAGWNKYFTQRQTEEEVKAEFANGAYGIAEVLYPASDFIVLDFDGPHAEQAQARARIELPDTAKIFTPHGYHLYYLASEYFKQSKSSRDVRLIKSDCDCKKENGDSHPCGIDLLVNGISIIPPTPGYREDPVHPIEDAVEIPEAVVKLMLKVEKEKKNTMDLIGNNGGIPRGERNATLTSLAGSMRQKGYILEAIFAVLQEENKSKCNPPLDQKEVWGIAKSVSKYPTGKTVSIEDATQALDGLSENTPLVEVDKALRDLALSLSDADPIRRVTAREAALKKLKVIKFSAPAKLVDAALQTEKNGESDLHQGQAIVFEDPEPWAGVVSGSALLDEIRGILTRYLVLPPHAPEAIALWIIHSCALDAFSISPLLAVSSPTKRAGKTLLLEVISCLLTRMIFASNIRPASLFRVVEKFKPCLLIDEADTFLRDNDELRGIINASHRKASAYVVRTVGDKHEPAAFSTWCPKAIALIGKLPGTLEDRSILIPMKRRGPGEKVERFRVEKLGSERNGQINRRPRILDPSLPDLPVHAGQVPGYS